MSGALVAWKKSGTHEEMGQIIVEKTLENRSTFRKIDEIYVENVLEATGVLAS
jgi:hypothetical protein